VTRLSDSCFRDCIALPSITIPSSVTSLGTRCFQSCSGLTSFTFNNQNNISTIGSYTFLNCTLAINVYYKNTSSYDDLNQKSKDLQSQFPSGSQYFYLPITTVITAPPLIEKIDIDLPFAIGATSNNDEIPIQYSSSDTGICTVDSFGIVTIFSVGTAMVTSWQPEIPEYYTAGSTGTTIEIVNSIITTVITAPETITKTYGELPFEIGATSNNNETPIEYTCSDTGICTVGSTSGIVTIVAVGTTTVTSSQPETEDYTAGSTGTNIIINDSTIENPTILSSGIDLAYFVTTGAVYGELTNDVNLTNDLLSSETLKIIFTNNNDLIQILKTPPA
jgi:hypothetical protein